MNKKFLVYILLAIFFSGCATMGGTETALLKKRVSELEAELAEKNSLLASAEESAAIGDDEVVFDDSIIDKIKSKSATSTTKSSSQKSNARYSKKNIQLALKKAGYYKGQIDGQIGKNTRAAIRAFQKANGLKADGVVGKRTWSKLTQYL